MRRKGTRVVYKNPWMTLREDAVILANGQEGIYGVVEKADFVVVLPCDADHVWLVEQFRYAVSGRYWEFPQGGCEKDASPEQTAHKELKEETGLLADKVELLGTVYEAYGYSNQKMHVFLASGLSETGEQELDPEEGELIYKRFTISDMEHMMREGIIKDGASLAAYGLWRLSPAY